MKKNEGILKVDVSDQGLVFPKNGVFVSVEFMGNVNKHQQLLPKSAPNASIFGAVFMGGGNGQYPTWSTVHNRRWSVFYFSARDRKNLLMGIEADFEQ